MWRVIGTVVGTFLTLIGLASLPQDVATWAQWLNTDSGRTTLVIVGVLAILTAWDVPQRLWRKLKSGNRQPNDSLWMSDTIFRDHVDQFLQRANRILDTLNSSGQRVSEDVFGYIRRWSQEATQFMERHGYHGDAAQIRIVPVGVEEYDRAALIGYIRMATGWLQKRREERNR